MSKPNLTHVLKTGAIAAALALSGFAAQAHAHGGGHGGHGPRGGHAMMMLSEHALDLVDATDAQRAQIRQIMKTAREELRAQRQGSRQQHEQAMALFAAPNIDAAAIESLRQQGQAQREAASKRMSQALIDAARVLTPEQRAKLADRMKKRHARMAEHMQHGGPGAR